MYALKKDPKMNWDECMDEGRTLHTEKVYGRQAVPTVCKSWKGDPKNPKESTKYPVRVYIDVNNPELMFLRPHEAERLLGVTPGCTSGARITAISRLKGIGQGWDINVCSMLLGYLPMPDGDQSTDWCMQFKTDDQVKVWNDKETISAWVDGTVKYMSKPKSEIRVDYPITFSLDMAVILAPLVQPGVTPNSRSASCGLRNISSGLFASITLTG